jgi:hypothetical protein
MEVHVALGRGQQFSQVSRAESPEEGRFPGYRRGDRTPLSRPSESAGVDRPGRRTESSVTSRLRAGGAAHSTSSSDQKCVGR